MRSLQENFFYFSSL